jgi:hypothetical protein
LVQERVAQLSVAADAAQPVISDLLHVVDGVGAEVGKLLGLYVPPSLPPDRSDGRRLTRGSHLNSPWNRWAPRVIGERRVATQEEAQHRTRGAFPRLRARRARRVIAARAS